MGRLQIIQRSGLIAKIQNLPRCYYSGFIFKKHKLDIVGIPICFHPPAGIFESFEVPILFEVCPDQFSQILWDWYRCRFDVPPIPVGFRVGAWALLARHIRGPSSRRNALLITNALKMPETHSLDLLLKCELSVNSDWGYVTRQWMVVNRLLWACLSADVHWCDWAFQAG